MNTAYHHWRKIKSGLVSACCCACALVVIVPLALVLFKSAARGPASLDLDFSTQLPKPVGEPGGGMANAIVGSLILVGLAGLVGVPVGVLGGIYLSEYGSAAAQLGRALRGGHTQRHASIVWGMVVYALVVGPLKGFGLCGRTGAGFHHDPADHPHHRGNAGAGAQQLPRSGLCPGHSPLENCLHCPQNGRQRHHHRRAAGGCARVAGETAPLLFTALGQQFWSHKLSEPIAALPLQIFDYANSPYDDWRRQAWAGALVLILFVLTLNIGVRRDDPRPRRPHPVKISWHDQRHPVARFENRARARFPPRRPPRVAAGPASRPLTCGAQRLVWRPSGVAQRVACKFRPEPSPRSSAPAAAANPPSCAA